MSHSTTEVVIPVANGQPAIIKPPTLFTTTYLVLFECVGHIFTLASTTVRGGLVVHLRNIWAYYHWYVAYGAEGVHMPHSALSFMINALLALAELKSQCLPGFPFQTHPRLVMFTVNSLLTYGLASAAEYVVSAAGLDPNSVYAITAHLAKMGSLCFLVASLASLFYI